MGEMIIGSVQYVGKNVSVLHVHWECPVEILSLEK